MLEVDFKILKSSLRTQRKFSLFLEVDFEQDKIIGSSLPKFQKFIPYMMDVLFIFRNSLQTRKKLRSSL
jgi:hypothetical protein